MMLSSGRNRRVVTSLMMRSIRSWLPCWNTGLAATASIKMYLVTLFLREGETICIKLSSSFWLSKLFYVDTMNCLTSSWSTRGIFMLNMDELAVSIFSWNL